MKCIFCIEPVNSKKKIKLREYLLCDRHELEYYYRPHYFTKKKLRNREVKELFPKSQNYK